jgi:hypothetical protein
VDERRAEWHRRSVAAKPNGRAPQNGVGKYLLSGGLLICATCGGHFEFFKRPWRADGIYICSTRRRKPGACTNTLTLARAEADDAVLDLVEGEALGTRFIEERLALVDQGEVDQTAQITAERDRLRSEVDRLVGSLASGVPADAVAPAIRERERAISVLEAKLR